MGKQKAILCYGDSNTWGFVPGSPNYETFYKERYPRDVRWTGLLQHWLGDDYYVIEEGLNARTTNVDYKDFPGRNGKTYLLPCLYSHAPLDLVILCLGVNDLKVEFNRSADDIAAGLEELITIIQGTLYGADMQSAPNILLVNNTLLTNESFAGPNGELVFAGAIEKARQLPQKLADLAEKKKCHFLDVTPHVAFSAIDGIHLDAAGNKKFAELILQEVKTILAIAQAPR